MTRLLAGRLLGAVGAVFGASVISFLVLRAIPGDPARLILGPRASAEQVAAFSRSLGLDDALPAQYVDYMSAFIRGDWGYSYSTGATVRDIFGQRLAASAELALAAFAGAFIAALLLAVLTTYRRRRIADAAVRIVAFVGLGAPQFWLGILLLVVFSQGLHLFPGPEGRLSPDVAPPPSITGLYTVDALLTLRLGTFLDAVWHLVLPALCLGLFAFGYLVRLLRASLLDVGREPFLLVVRGKGLSRLRTSATHALPNAFLPTLTAAGLLFAQLLGGSVLVESVFDWPGLGAFVVQSIQRQDLGFVQSFILLSAIVYVAVNLVIDVLYGVVDPRVRA